MVPEAWKVQTLSKVLEKVSVPVLVKADEKYQEIGIRSHGKGIFHKDPITGKQLGEKRVFHIEPDCLVLNIVFAWEQAVAKTSQSELGMIASHRFPMFRPIKSACNIDFILCLFKTKYGKYLLELASPGGAGRNKTLGQAEFLNLELTLPPLNEQNKIAQIISTWDKAITTTEKLLENSQKQKQALIQQLLTGKKRFPGFNEKWTTKSLGQIGEIRSAGVDKNIIEGEKPVRLLNFTDVFKRSFIYSKELNHWVTAPAAKVLSCDIKKGDVFFTPSSETRNEAGIPAVAAEDIDDCCYSYHVVRFRLKEEWDLSFKAYIFTTPEFRKQACMLADGSGQRYVISQDGFRGIKITYPSYQEQVLIGKAIKAAEDEVNLLKQKISHFKEEKKALMQQLLTGKRRVELEI